MPALHLLVLEDRTLAILDGQQRMRALTEFLNDMFPIGKFEPFNAEVAPFQGSFFSMLPVEKQREILDYKVPSYRLYEYDAPEPYELFFRLNQPTGLTQAEKRNSLVGQARAQVKSLVALANEAGWSKEHFGFTNSRLAYDDIIARTCEYIEENNLNTPVTSSAVESRYRSKFGFTDQTLQIAANVITHAGARHFMPGSSRVRLNKATLLTWLLVEARRITNPHLEHLRSDEAFFALEARRVERTQLTEVPGGEVLAAVWTDRSSLRVGDTLSVVARDLCVWMLAALQSPSALSDPLLHSLREDYESTERNGELTEDSLLAMFSERALWSVIR